MLTFNAKQWAAIENEMIIRFDIELVETLVAQNVEKVSTIGRKDFDIFVGKHCEYFANANIRSMEGLIFLIELLLNKGDDYFQREENKLLNDTLLSEDLNETTKIKLIRFEQKPAIPPEN